MTNHILCKDCFCGFFVVQISQLNTENYYHIGYMMCGMVVIAAC